MSDEGTGKRKRKIVQDIEELVDDVNKAGFESERGI